MMDFNAFRRRFSLRLDEQQEAAVRQTEGPVLLLAVPGSGKTTALISRIGCLLYCREIDPRAILTMTYTVAATNDMRRRFQALFGEEYAPLLEFRTINGVCAKIIRQYEQRAGREAFHLITEEGESNRLLREAYRRCGLPYPSESEIEDRKTKIAFCKNGMMSDEQIREMDESDSSFFPIYQTYREILLEKRLMDYDDQMVYGLKILRTYPQILWSWQRRYRYFCVDEAQDTSRIQHEIIRLLASESRNLFMVGDEDQTIYGFRAAYPKALTEFQTLWPEGRVLLLETNYRSSAQIVERADAFIRHNTDRHEKHMHTPNPQGEPIRITELRRRWDQYAYLTELAKQKSGQIAVLYRNNECALPLIDLLDKQGISYRCREQKSVFFTHPVLRDIRDYLSLAAAPDLEEPFLRIYYKLRCGISRELAQRAVQMGKRHPGRSLVELAGLLAGEDWRSERIASVWEQLCRLPSDGSLDALRRIGDPLGYRAYLEGQSGDASKLDILEALARQNPGQQELLSRLDALEDIASRGGTGRHDGLILSTIHASKGLEYDRVILMDCFDGLLPQTTSPVNREEELILAEERRLFYVAATRARSCLEVLRYGEKDSLFIRQLMGESPRQKIRPVPKPSKKPAFPKYKIKF